MGPMPRIFRIRCLLLVACFLGVPPLISYAADPLPALGAESMVTVSGVSSGGYMAAQFAVAFSKDVTGVGVIAGGPFQCSQGNLATATTSCSCLTSACFPQVASVLAFESWNAATGKEALNLVDPVAGLKSQRVWLFTGKKDKIVPRQNVEALRLFYTKQAGATTKQVHFQDQPGTGHGMPIIKDPVGVDCPLTRFPFINNCNEDVAGELLAWLLPGATMVSATPASDGLRAFDQNVYTQGLDYTGLGDTGYVFVPKACAARGSGCRVHVVFHGCQQAKESDNGAGGHVDRLFVDHAGYNRWAEGSRIIVLYPQVMPHDTGGIPFQNNPQGCWDFWGYTELFPLVGIFATNAAPQMLAVRRMITALQK